ncbi:GAF and ANTAR domain-containing protein [Tsukamurella soli]|uniref:GAF and ANTAR domain-containing protein n=1 Tax=Tsukamurella soli TaxID=644556 RepID=A0ABP8K4N2_9ACTN
MTEFAEGGDHVPGLPASAERTRTDVSDLQDAIGDLSGLVAGSLGLAELLAQVAALAVHAIPGADGAGVTLLHLDRTEQLVEALGASASFVRDVDQIQYVTVREGPCITAALQSRTVRSGSLGGDRMWPRFGPRAGRLGVHSVLSLPLRLPDDEVVGAINVYAHQKDAFDDRAAELGETFARPAAVVVHNAQSLAHARTLVDQLQTALSTRPVINQAIGILRGRSGRSTEETVDQLRAISQAEHRKLADVAQRIVDEAVRRARSRHVDSG